MKTITRITVIPGILLLSFISLSAYAAPAEKFTICHNGHTITVSGNSLDAHEAHGDTSPGRGGACKPANPGHDSTFSDILLEVFGKKK